MTSKKEALAVFHRNNIIAAAEKLFLINGIQETTVDDIAKEADYSKTTLYVYFRSKDEIYDCILLKSMNVLLEKLTDAINSHGEFEDKYYTLCNSLLIYAQEFPLYFNSILASISCEKESIFNTGEKINDLIRDFMLEAVQAGYLRADLKFPEIILIMWASIAGIIQMASAKSEYIGIITEDTPEGFAHYGFTILLESIKKEKANK
jgi:AcrR family transcriptional regulator